MTYLIVGNTPENIQTQVTNLIGELWKREINIDVFQIQNPDLHVLDGRALNSIGIEQMKELQSEMMYTPFKEFVQVALIFDSPKLTVQAQNSILKTLEESSDTTAYILTTNSEKALLPTICSRSRKIYIREEAGQDDDLEDIDNFLKLDIIERFLKIETISKEKGSCLEFLDRLERYFQVQLEDAIRGAKDGIIAIDSISQIGKARARIKANGNRRLVLENMFLQLEGTF